MQWHFRLLYAATLCLWADAAPAQDPVTPSNQSPTVIGALVDRETPLPQLTLDDALRRVIDHHPELRALRRADAVLDAEVELAGQRPGQRLELELENLLGSGQSSAFDGAELTLALASLIERGDKRHARVAVAEGQRSLLEPQLRARELDLLGEVTLRWLDAAAAQARAALAEEAATERGKLVDAARLRVKAGALPGSVPLSVQAAQQRALAEAAQARRQAEAAQRRLALLWGAGFSEMPLAPVDFSVLPDVPALSRVQAASDEHPALRQLAAEQRLREARLRLAQSQAQADLEWRVGLRWLGDANDWGLMGALSLPLGSAARAAPAIRARAAELEALALEREAQTLSLTILLGQVWANLDDAVAMAQALDDDVLPLLQQAEIEAGRAFAAGASGYLEWAQLQAELLQLRTMRLAAAVDAQRALLELQRLSGRGVYAWRSGTAAAITEEGQ